MFNSLQLLVAATVVSLSAIACAAPEEFSPYRLDQGLSASLVAENSEELDLEGQTEGSECQEDQVLDCQITHELASGTLFCVKGLQFCNDGYWSECHSD